MMLPTLDQKDGTKTTSPITIERGFLPFHGGPRVCLGSGLLLSSLLAVSSLTFSVAEDFTLMEASYGKSSASFRPFQIQDCATWSSPKKPNRIKRKQFNSRICWFRARKTATCCWAKKKFALFFSQEIKSRWGWFYIYIYNFIFEFGSKAWTESKPLSHEATTAAVGLIKDLSLKAYCRRDNPSASTVLSNACPYRDGSNTGEERKIKGVPAEQPLQIRDIHRQQRCFKNRTHIKEFGKIIVLRWKLKITIFLVGCFIPCFIG